MDEALIPIAEGLEGAPLEGAVLLCMKCAPTDEDGLASWMRLKDRTRSAKPPEPGKPSEVLRGKVDCFGVCTAGPTALVLPGGIWYTGVTPDVVDRIIDEHIGQGRPIEEHVIARTEALGE
jgi:(2Fe-2S) ferredoxin